MSNKELHATIKLDGTVSLEGVGFTDNSCKASRDRMMSALGVSAVSEVDKPEAYVQPSTEATVAANGYQ